MKSIYSISEAKPECTDYVAKLLQSHTSKRRVAKYPCPTSWRQGRPTLDNHKKDRTSCSVPCQGIHNTVNTKSMHIKCAIAVP